ncbi:hypothetical protein AGOR_G00212620 [Albula goreensis]|uniref:Uncharacterized protein n=1 Tax=Albula goreensis TaxID=1534307 RepID=A0A8T3CSR7_9TELE|nr:hypothetical protein AGOR_G00212620 [Albula goreensis]
MHVYDVCVSVFEGSETKTGQHLQKLWPGCTTDSGLSQKISSFRLSVQSVCLTARSSSLSGSIYTYRTGEMKGKLVIAVILALQVSASPSELPQPDEELLEKFKEVKVNLLLGILKAGEWMGSVFGSVLEFPMGLLFRYYDEFLANRPEVKSAIKITMGVAGDVTRLVDKAEMTALGLYSEYVRPWAGTYLDQGITYIKSILNTGLPKIHK